MHRLFSIIIISTIVLTVSAQSTAKLMDAGNKAFDSGNYSQATILFLKADSAFRAEGKDATTEYAQSLHNLGRSYMSVGDNSKGRDYTLRAATLREKLLGRQSEPYITSLNNYALGWYNDNDYRQALELHKEVIVLCESLPKPHKDEGMFRTNLGRDYLALGLQDSAAIAMEHALPLVEKFGQIYEFLLYYLGEIYIDRNDTKNIDRILTLQDEHNEHELLNGKINPSTMLQRAEYYQNKNDIAKARDAYLQLLEMDLPENSKAMIYQKYAGFLNLQILDHVQASDYYMLASQAGERAGMKRDYVLNMMLNSGLCAYIGNEYDKAITIATEILDRAKKAHETRIIINALDLMGKNQKALKKYDKAISTYTELLDLIESENKQQTPQYAKALRSLAFAESRVKDYDKAINHYKKAIEMFADLKMDSDLEFTKGLLTNCYLYAGLEPDNSLTAGENASIAKAKELLRGTLAELQITKNHFSKLDYAHDLGSIAYYYHVLEEPDNAVEYYSNYVAELRQAILETFRLSNAKDRENLWKEEIGTIRDISLLITEIPDASPLKAQCAATMFDLQLLRKGLLLTSAIEFEKLLQHRGDPSLTKNYYSARALAEAITVERQKATTAEETADIARRQTELDRMMLDIYKECAEAGDYTDYLRYDIGDVRKALPENAVAVEFVILNDMVLPEQCHAAALVMRKDSPEITIVMLPTVAELRNMAASSDLTVNEEYGRLIWDGIVKTGDFQQIFFSPDGALHQIPLEYLNLDGAIMADRYDMVRLTSTKELCRDHKPFEFNTMILFGDIDYDADPNENTAPQPEQDTIDPDMKRQSAGPNLAKLPGTRLEINTIDSLYRTQATTKLYAGAKATKEAFVESQKQHPGILHVSTHGKYQPQKGITEDQSMINSVLAFAGANNYDDMNRNPAMANAAEIAGMDLDGCRLTVLSACESGLGKAGDDGIFGLQRGFKNAGVESLIVTLQSVIDMKAAELMIAFYRHLHEGLSPRHALRKARAEARRTDPSDTTWASFILIDGF